MEQTQKRRDAAPDILKLISCFAVILIHVSNRGMDGAPGTPDWLSAVFWDGLCRFAVPVFFMCTGALMLPPERSLTARRIWKDYFLRILWILLFWALIYQCFLFFGYMALGYSGWDGWVTQLIVQPLLWQHHGHLYYLQMLLLLYAVLPVLRVFTRSASRRELLYAVLVWLALGIAYPLLRQFEPLVRLGGVMPLMEINLCWGVIGYALLGHLLSGEEPRRAQLKWFALAFACGFALTFGGTVAASLRSGATVLTFLEGMSPGPCLMSAGLFGAVRILVAGKVSSPALQRLTRASFCVYLVHHIFVMILWQLGGLEQFMPPVLSAPLESILVAALSLASWWVLSRIPFVKDHLI